MITLGLDIGSNSVGSAWMNTDQRVIALGVSVFPAGVDETDGKRGSPKNQERREKRSRRRSIARRAKRKLGLRLLLTEVGLLPTDAGELQRLTDLNPWVLRREACERKLTPHEFGRALLHLNQRRGALGVSTDPDNKDQRQVNEAIDRTHKQLAGRTFGQFMADLMDERRHALPGKSDKYFHDPVRNRRDSFLFHADRTLIREEFQRMWEYQRSRGGPLAKLMTEELRKRLDDPAENDTWRHQGAIFGQRRTFWDPGTLGRCDLEPTDQRCSLADMYAQDYRVVESVNNIRIRETGKPERPLSHEERGHLISYLRGDKVSPLDRFNTGKLAKPKRLPKNVQPRHIREILGLGKKTLAEHDLPEDWYDLNIKRNADRSVNVDWFHREFVHGVFTEEKWREMDAKTREAVNRAILKFDPDHHAHADRLRTGSMTWWGLDEEAADRLIAAWKSRPKLEKRVTLSRRAMRNLLPYMNEYDDVKGRWPTLIEARQRFAEDPEARDVISGEPATDELRRRYALGARKMTKSNRQYLKKHPDLLPPAPVMANPVMRKAIHEVRRHVNAYLRKFGRKPDRIVVELARSATQSEHIRDGMLSLIRKRRAVRSRIVEQYKLGGRSSRQQARAIQRVLLCRQQKDLCAYTGRTIGGEMAADGSKLEIDHIIPRSRSNDNGLNNKVLCFRDANRDKGDRTVKEWLGADSPAFGALRQRLGHLVKTDAPDDYFTKRDRERKWENLHRDAPGAEEFQASQLTDNAYASRQVMAYLRDALYADNTDPGRGVFTTQGIYTAMLRSDWGLVESELDRRSERTIAEQSGDDDDVRVSRRDKKYRSDHKQHAIDAVAIAFATGTTNANLARFMQQQELARARTGRWPRRQALKTPWGSTESFRRQVLEAVSNLVVCHRPIKRRLIGAFHEETAYGPVLGSDTLITNRLGIRSLTPHHLRVADGSDELSERLAAPGLSTREQRAIRREMWSLTDPPPGKSGIVRDRELRRRLRACLRDKEIDIDPDNFTKDDMRRVWQGGLLKMPGGVPIKSVVLLRTNNDLVVIPRRKWNPSLTRYVKDPDPRTARVYIGGNNHHIEIRELTRTTEHDTITQWVGEVVGTFEAAKRNAARLKAIKLMVRRSVGPWVRDPPKAEPTDPPGAHGPTGWVVDRSDNDKGDFVMSLAEGETIYARRKDRPNDPPTYFVVCMLDRTGNLPSGTVSPCRIHFAPHWDARPPRGMVPAGSQDRWSVTPGDLAKCGSILNHPPYKVWVSPLGEVKSLNKD